MKRHALYLVSLVALTACYPSRRAPIVLTPREAFNRYPPADQELIRAGRFRVGLDELAVYLARGAPAFYWHTRLGGGPGCNALLYGSSDAPTGEGDGQVDLVVYACGGSVVHLAAGSPALPCWRLANVAPRLVERSDYFDALPLGRQWELIAGVLRRGQTATDVYLAFGHPYNTGVEAREDGTNAASQVFLDSTGDSYGLYVTLVSDTVVGWRIPPDRTLTPEAQQRRLQALQQNLAVQLQALETRSIERHRQEMSLLNTLQAQGQQIIATQTSGFESATQQRSGGASGPSSGGSAVGGPPATVTGSNQLSVNGCTYTDSPGGALGRSCGHGQGCPHSYACLVMGSSASGSGVCVPQGQGCGGTPRH